MKRTECNDFKNAVKGIISSWLTFSLSSMLNSVIHTKSCFQEATDMSRAEPVKSFLPISNIRPPI